MDTLKKLISGRLAAQAAGPHPDPELLAAFSEHSLPESESNLLLKHVATCAECRDVLYLAASVIPETQQVLAVSPKHPRFAMRWATLAASVIILAGIFVTNRGLFTGHTSRPSEISPAAPAKAKTVQERTVPIVDQAAPAGNAPARVRPPAKHMTAKPQASLQFDQSGEVHFSPQTTEHFAAAAPAKSHDFVAPVATWNISPEGVPQRSFDSGKTWQAVAVAERVTFRAVSSTGESVWIGGNAGTLYHSIDAGHSWSRVTPVFANATLQSDITRIEFSDAENGSVSTVNGQVWTTSDGGKNWQLQ